MIAWLSKLLGSELAGRFAGIMAAAVLAAALYVSGFYFGYAQKTKVDAAAQLKVEQAKVKELQALQKQNGELVSQLAALRATKQEIYFTLRGVMANVSQPIVAVEPDGVASCTVSNGYVRVWNDALAARMPEAAGGVTDTAGAAGDAADSQLGVGELLANHVENAEREAHNRDQCEALIAWHQQHD